METSEMIWIATWSFAKNLDYEELSWSDYMYDHRDLTDEVWKYVEELHEDGRKAFYEKYKEFKLY